MLSIEQLVTIIAERAGAAPEHSYTARLLQQGTARIAQKVGEEGVETAIAAMQHDRTAITSEACDLLYHLFVLLYHEGVTLSDIQVELARRHQTMQP